MTEMWNSYEGLSVNLYRRHGWKLDVKMNITGRGWEHVERINVGEDTVKGFYTRSLMFGFHRRQKISLPPERLSDCPEGLCSIESSVNCPTARNNYLLHWEEFLEFCET
jgi:hypothetical protein